MINEDPKDALLRKYKEEIEQLRLMLEGGAGVSLEGSSGVGVSVVESSGVQSTSSPMTTAVAMQSRGGGVDLVRGVRYR